MANMTIRDLPESAKKSLRIQAAQAGVSLEAHARHILQVASASGANLPPNILGLAEKYFGPKHGVKLDLAKRRSKRRPIDFSV